MAEITSVESSWLPDETATISGSAFGSDTGYVNLVYENLGEIVECAVSDWSPTAITILLPAEMNADEAVYLEVGGPNANYFTARSVSTVTATPTVEPPAHLRSGTWVTLKPGADVAEYPSVTFLAPIGQVWTWDEETEKYHVRWFPTSLSVGSPVAVTYTPVSASDLSVVGGLTFTRAFASGLLSPSRLLG